MIDKVLALSLNKSRTRRDIYIGRMTARGVPYERIHFVRGKAASDFKNDYNIIAERAKSDGFPFVRFFQGHGDTGMIQQTPAQMAQVWSYAQILRYIADGDETVLVTWDDRVLTVPFALLETIIDGLAKDESFYAFQLRLRGSPEYLDLPETEFWEDAYIHEKIFMAFTNLYSDLDYAEAFTKLGLYGYDETIVFSPAGARWMLDEMHKIKDIDPEIKQLGYFDVPLETKPIYCPTINIDNWICWGLRGAADKAAEEGRVHRPRFYGFNFIADPIPQGSLTGWASKEFPQYAEVADAEFKYNWLDL